ncbi:MAG: hypothetical protein P9X24_12365 [Candidatus Hatepunaea meridiana]|nr:hypothetical protein [Candidatus Hatepunaea meridiana]
MRFTTLVIAALITVFLIGCGGTKPPTIHPDASSQTQGNIPEWYLDTSEDTNFLFAVGNGVSQDMDLAEDKAIQTATNRIAGQLEKKFNGYIKGMKEEAGSPENAQLVSTFTKATKGVVSTVLSGVTTHKKAIQREGNLWRVYVKMKMAKGASEQAMLNKMKQQEAMFARFRETQVMGEMEKEIEKFENYKKEQGQ